YGHGTINHAGSAMRSRRRLLRQTLAFLISLPAMAATPAAAESTNSWAEWTYHWKRLTIILRTNAGVYSPTLQALGIDSSAGPEETRPANLMKLLRGYFVMTSSLTTDQLFEFIEPLARKWGPGHALPILAAVTLENLQRPVPTPFG